MANSLNKVQLIGYLASDPEVRSLPNGQKFANFSVATNRTWMDASGIKQEKVEFHNCKAWRGLAGIAEQYMKKGGRVYLEGHLETSSWDDATTGAKRSKTEIVADSIILLGSNTGSGGGGYSSSSSEYSAPISSSEYSAPMTPNRAKPAQEEEISIEDIPF